MSSSERLANTDPVLSGLIDTHCHLDFSAFDEDREALLSKALALGFERIVIPGTVARDFPKIQALADQFPLIRMAVGLHPYFLDQHHPSDLTQVELMLSCPSVIAVGECGLDFFEADHQSDKQWALFDAQVELAMRYRKPLIVHNRKAHDQMASYLFKKRFDQGGVIHAFTGSVQQAKRYLDLGFCLGIGGSITYPRAQKVQRMVKALPKEAIVFETDAPDMPLFGHQGERNSPLKVIEVINALAALTALTADEWVEQGRRNAYRVLPGLRP
jgi:TatD DNase family protein